MPHHDRVTPPASALSVDEARQMLVEYLAVLQREKDGLYTEFGEQDPQYTATAMLRRKLYKHGTDRVVLTDEEYVYVVLELRRRAADGTAPTLIVDAFLVWQRSLPERRREAEDEVRRALEVSTPRQVRAEINRQGAKRYSWLMREAVHTVLAGNAWPARPARVAQWSGHVRPRCRESQRRSSRSCGGRGSPARPDSSDDPPLADLQRRCPRCGGLLRPLLPSPHWTCDPCAEALWERMVAYELVQVLAEADRILRGESA